MFLVLDLVALLFVSRAIKAFLLFKPPTLRSVHSYHRGTTTTTLSPSPPPHHMQHQYVQHQYHPPQGLRGLNQPTTAARMTYSSAKKYHMSKAWDELSEVEQNIHAACTQLLDLLVAKILIEFLVFAYPEAFRNIFGEAEDDGGFIKVRRKGRGTKRDTQQMIDDWVD